MTINSLIISRIYGFQVTLTFGAYGNALGVHKTETSSTFDYASVQFALPHAKSENESIQKKLAKNLITDNFTHIHLRSVIEKKIVSKQPFHREVLSIGT